MAILQSGLSMPDNLSSKHRAQKNLANGIAGNRGKPIVLREHREEKNNEQG
jgi:hypothetical protein